MPWSKINIIFIVAGNSFISKVSPKCCYKGSQIYKSCNCLSAFVHLSYVTTVNKFVKKFWTGDNLNSQCSVTQITTRQWSDLRLMTRLADQSWQVGHWLHRSLLPWGHHSRGSLPHLKMFKWPKLFLKRNFFQEDYLFLQDKLLFSCSINKWWGERWLRDHPQFFRDRKSSNLQGPGEGLRLWF